MNNYKKTVAKTVFQRQLINNLISHIIQNFALRISPVSINACLNIKKQRKQGLSGDLKAFDINKIAIKKDNFKKVYLGI